MERGIITLPVEITSKENSWSVKAGISPEKLRYYILYWDKVIVTDNDMIGYNLSEEEKILEEAKILTKSTAKIREAGRYGPAELSVKYLQGLDQIASILINKQPGQWAIHQSGEQLILPLDMSSELITADIELNQCLPVPNSDIQLDRILDFKIRHADELLALRITLDELYLEITKSTDIPRSKIVQIQRLEQAIKDLDHAAKQSWGERLLASRKVSLDINFGSITQGLVTAGLVGNNFNNPLIGLIAGAANTIASSMKFEVAISNQLTSTQGQQVDLSYLSSIKNEDIAN